MTDDHPGASLDDSDVPLVARYDTVLLDLDGVVYIGPRAVTGAAQALADARAAGLRVVFVTNNASRPPDTVATHLRELGVAAQPADVVTSAQAAAGYLAGRLQPGDPVLVVGGTGLLQALAEAGLRSVYSLNDHPRAVVQGFSPDLGWRQLAEGTRAVRSGLPWVATNLDMTVPSVYGIAPGNGTFVAAVRIASGCEPFVVGKPEPGLFAEAMRRSGAQAALVVGDRLDTDLAGARRSGLPGLLVFTGVSGPGELLGCPPSERPHFIGADLTALLHAHPAVVRDGEWWRCRQVGVRLDRGGSVDVDVPTPAAGPGHDGLDLLRAGCVMSWFLADHGDDTGRLEFDALLTASERCRSAAVR